MVGLDLPLCPIPQTLGFLNWGPEDIPESLGKFILKVEPVSPWILHPQIWLNLGPLHQGCPNPGSTPDASKGLSEACRGHTHLPTALMDFRMVFMAIKIFFNALQSMMPF